MGWDGMKVLHQNNNTNITKACNYTEYEIHILNNINVNHCKLVRSL